MSDTIKITGHVAVWLPDYYTPTDLRVCCDKGSPDEVLGLLSLFGKLDRKTFSKAVRVGDAEVTVTFYSANKQVQSAMTALNAQMEQARAEFLTKQAEIMERISKLQALTNEVEA